MYEVKIREISGNNININNKKGEEPKTNKIEEEPKTNKIEKHEIKDKKVDEIINNNKEQKQEVVITNPNVEEDIISDTRKKEMDLIDEQIKKKDLSNHKEEPKAKSGFFKTTHEDGSPETKFDEENFEKKTETVTETKITKSNILPEGVGKSNESFKSPDKKYKVRLSVNSYQLDQNIKNTDEIYIKELQKIADNTNFDLNLQNQMVNFIIYFSFRKKTNLHNT